MLNYFCVLHMLFLCLTVVQLMSGQIRQQPQRQLMNLHLLANPGDSLLLQQTLDRLLRWLCPTLRIFHVSERASPFRSYTRLCPVAGDLNFLVLMCSTCLMHILSFIFLQQECKALLCHAFYFYMQYKYIFLTWINAFHVKTRPWYRKSNEISLECRSAIPPTNDAH